MKLPIYLIVLIGFSFIEMHNFKTISMKLAELPVISVNTRGTRVKCRQMKHAIPGRGESRAMRKNIAIVRDRLKHTKAIHTTRFLMVWPRVIPFLEVIRDEAPYDKERIERRSLPIAMLTFFPSQIESEKLNILPIPC
jgi:hypothetical protein